MALIINMVIAAVASMLLAIPLSLNQIAFGIIAAAIVLVVFVAGKNGNVALLLGGLLAVAVWVNNPFLTAFILFISTCFILVELMTFRVPENHAAVLSSRIFGLTNKVKTEGFRVKGLTEYVYATIDIRQRTVEIKREKYQSTSSPIMVALTMDWRPDPRYLTTFVRLEESVIAKGLTDKVKSALRVSLNTRKSEEVLDKSETIAEEVLHVFRGGRERSQLEDDYGIEIIRFTIPTIELDPEIEEERKRKELEERQSKNEEYETEQFVKQAKLLMEQDKTLTFQQALSYVTQLRGRGTTRKEINISGLSGSGNARPEIELKIDD